MLAGECAERGPISSKVRSMVRAQDYAVARCVEVDRKGSAGVV